MIIRLFQKSIYVPIRLLTKSTLWYANHFEEGAPAVLNITIWDGRIWRIDFVINVEKFKQK